MTKLTKKSNNATGKTQAHGGALLAAILQHLVKEVPGFATITATDFFKKTAEYSEAGFAISFVFLQDYHTPTEDFDEIVLAQIMIFLANTNQIDSVNEIVVNLITNGFGSE